MLNDEFVENSIDVVIYPSLYSGINFAYFDEKVNDMDSYMTKDDCNELSVLVDPSFPIELLCDFVNKKIKVIFCKCDPINRLYKIHGNFSFGIVRNQDYFSHNPDDQRTNEELMKSFENNINNMVVIYKNHGF